VEDDFLMTDENFDYEAEKILGLDDILYEDLLDDYDHLSYPDAAMADKDESAHSFSFLFFHRFANFMRIV
jgi:hypothetical protein